MKIETANVMVECTRASDEERVTFPEVVRKLIAAGVERYHADLTRAEKTYYMPDGEALTLATAPIVATPPDMFSTAGVAAAIRAIQSGTIKYKRFCEDIAAAGCVGYFVSLAGRRAVYYGRTGDMHVELFPGAN